MPATVNPDARYRIEGHGAIAWYVVGYATEWTEGEWVHDGEGDPDDEGSYFYNEAEEYELTDQVRVVMVGDDREWIIGTDALVEIGEDDYCSCCGQIGCGWS